MKLQGNNAMLLANLTEKSNSFFNCSFSCFANFLVKEGANAAQIVDTKLKITIGIFFVIDNVPIAIAFMNKFANSKSNPCPKTLPNFVIEFHIPEFISSLILFKSKNLNEMLISGVRIRVYRTLHIAI